VTRRKASSGGPFLLEPKRIVLTGIETRVTRGAQWRPLLQSHLQWPERLIAVSATSDHPSVICFWTHLADARMGHAQDFGELVDSPRWIHACIDTDTNLTQLGSRFRRVFAPINSIRGSARLVLRIYELQRIACSFSLNVNSREVGILAAEEFQLGTRSSDRQKIIGGSDTSS
jgi:hypothetical protein